MNPAVTDTLVYYDGPQVVECLDADGTRYVGVLVNEATQVFFLVSVSPERLGSLRAGKTDLLSLFVSPDGQPCWLGTLQQDRIQFEREVKPEPAYLPGPGLFLN